MLGVRQIRSFAFAIAALTLATPAAADIVVIQGNSPQTDENVLLTRDQTGNPLTGVTQISSFEVNILGNESLIVPSDFQARVAAVDGGLSYLLFSLADFEYGFSSLILNIDAFANGIVTFQANDQLGGTFNSGFAVGGSGDNFFTLVTINGQLFTDISFTSDVSIVDVGQIRLGGITPLNTAPGVPEPATWAMMLLGFGAVGVALRRGRRGQFTNATA